jgi:hypothetical protein
MDTEILKGLKHNNTPSKGLQLNKIDPGRSKSLSECYTLSCK